MYVKEIWRYPVKSLAGEQLHQTQLTALGLPGDRRIAILSERGRWITARKYRHLLALKASTAADGTALIDGLPWYEAEAQDAVRKASEPTALLVPVEGPESFDVLPLSIATDGAVAYMAVDRRRFRPNLLIGGVEGLAERQWPGGALRIGSALIRMVKLRARCVMTTWDPDTQAQDPSVLQRIVDELEGTLSLDSLVEQPGLVHVGDAVELIPAA